MSLAKCRPKLTMIPKKAFGTFGNLLPCRSERLRCKLGHSGVRAVLSFRLARPGLTLIHAKGF